MLRRQSRPASRWIFLLPQKGVDIVSKRLAQATSRRVWRGGRSLLPDPGWNLAGHIDQALHGDVTVRTVRNIDGPQNAAGIDEKTSPHAWHKLQHASSRINPYCDCGACRAAAKDRAARRWCGNELMNRCSRVMHFHHPMMSVQSVPRYFRPFPGRERNRTIMHYHTPGFSAAMHASRTQ